jgi:hypothetical protein
MVKQPGRLDCQLLFDSWSPHLSQIYVGLANYLEFTSPDQCVAATVLLRDNPALRQEMMERNHLYCRTYLRPDALVWNTLQAADNRHSGGV